MTERKDFDKEERDHPKPSTCLGVFNLSFEATEKDLHELFFRYGKIDDISIVLDKVTNKSRGFAFIYFKELEDAEVAKEKVHGSIFQGKQLRVDFSITEGPHPPTPGEYKGNRPTDRKRKDSGSRGGRGGRRGGRGGRESRSFGRDRSRYDDDYDRRSPVNSRREKDWTDYYGNKSTFSRKSRYD